MNNLVYQDKQIKWLDVINPSAEELTSLSKEYDLDYHTLADCLEPNHLPKEEKLQNFTFIILRRYDRKGKYPSSIQEMSNKIAVFYNKEILITVHRSPIEFLNGIKSKYLETAIIAEPSEVVTKIMWHVAKSFEAISDLLTEEIDHLEKRVFLGRTALKNVKKMERITLEEMYYLKNSCRLNKKIIALTQDVINEHITISSDSSSLQDVKDLLKKLYLSFEETHDDAMNLSHTFLSIVSQKTNDVMKLLTIFSVFFMPLTFIVGIYGMNFDFMPELRWKFGYPLSLVVMLLISIVIYIWFKRKRIL